MGWSIMPSRRVVAVLLGLALLLWVALGSWLTFLRDGARLEP